jgi:hypothetical protein
VQTCGWFVTLVASDWNSTYRSPLALVPGVEIAFANRTWLSRVSIVLRAFPRLSARPLCLSTCFIIVMIAVLTMPRMSVKMIITIIVSIRVSPRSLSMASRRSITRLN